MAKKNTVLSVTASVVIASTMFGAQGVDAATHKVKSGDNLWSISQKYNTNVSQLKSWNSLSGNIIYPNQVLEIGDSKSSKKSHTSTNSSKTSSKTSSVNNNASSSKSSSTYTVKSGDTLSQIASSHGISTKDLMNWNNLNTTLIYPGDSLKVSKGSSSNSSSSNNSSTNKSESNSSSSKGSSTSNNSSSSNTSKSTYTVKSGDTLGQIASKHGVTVSQLKNWNNISSHLIYPGDKLSIGKNSSSSSSTSKNNSNSSTSSNNSSGSSNTNVSAPPSDDLISNAKSVIGTPYVWAGNTPNGFDCSGFIYWAFNESGEKISRLSSEGYYNRAYMVDNPQKGDLVFFEGTYKKGISHMGIYLGNNEFVHAGTSQGVTVSNLNSSYWSQHFDSFKRFY